VTSAAATHVKMSLFIATSSLEGLLEKLGDGQGFQSRQGLWLIQIRKGTSEKLAANQTQRWEGGSASGSGPKPRRAYKHIRAPQIARRRYAVSFFANVREY
jgi:hypothetical protein